MFRKEILLICVLPLVFTSFALATTVNEENCKAVGSALIRCYDCTPGSQRYLGNVAVLTGYEEAQGKKFCVVAAEAKDACNRVFGVSQNRIGYYTKFNFGMGTRDESYNTSCVEAVGK